MLKKIILFGLLMTVGATLAFAQAKSTLNKTTGITKRITLSKTKPCVILTGSVQPKNFDTYIFRAVKGQTIIASPFYYGDETDRPEDDVQGLSGFVIVLPNGRKVEDPQDDQFQAEKTGEYKILVRPAYTRTTTKYALKISVTNKLPGLSDPNEPPKCP